MVIAKHQQYETKPIDCWAKMKELRRARFRNNWEARSRGDLVIMGEHMGNKALWTGFGTGHYANMSFSPYWTGVIRNPDETVRLLSYVDSKGYGQQVCGALKIHLAHILMGVATKSPSGETIIPDFIYQDNFCPQVARLGHIVSKHLGVPYLYTESFRGSDPEKSREYQLEQVKENIERAEKITGMKYDDEKLIEAIKNELQTAKLVSQICELNKSIPAPLDGRQLASLGLPAVTMSHQKESVEFYKMLLDEVKYRVQNQISARGFERKRLMMDTFPWVAPHLFRYPEKYGAVVVAGDHPFLNARFEADENGDWVAITGIDELCSSIRTREDALRATVGGGRVGKSKGGHGSQNWRIEQVVGEPIEMAKQWHCDGMILAGERDCFQQMSFGLETKLLATSQGMPAMFFYSVLADIRQFDAVGLQKRFDIFLGSLGLTKISADEE
jgi:benzoyl-CoA reductase subunit B